METYNTEQIATLTSMAQTSGPFFYSMFFALILTGISHHYMRKNMRRKDPSATKEEKKIHMIFFTLSVAFTFISAVLALGSWFIEKYQAPKTHTFQIVIKGIDIDKRIFAEDHEIYLRTSQRDAGPGGIIQDYYYVKVKNQVFKDGDNFSFTYYPVTGSIGGPPENHSLDVTYSSNETAHYILVKNEDHYTLKKED